jgi:hypothetical protein
MADPAYWPDRVDLASFDPTSDDPMGSRSILDDDDFGGKATQRQLTIDGQEVTVCFILLEVIWDQAAAILADEARRFGPEKIIMTGGGVTTHAGTGEFEGGALNRAMDLSGYDTHGRSDARNVPAPSREPGVYPPILDRSAPGVREVLPMRWDGPYLVELTRPIARSIRRAGQAGIFDVEAVKDAKLNNIYLCNNISYATLAAIDGQPLHLAGGLVQAAAFGDPRGAWRDGDVLKIDIGQAFRRTTLAGFHHIPDTRTDAAQTMLGWAKVFAKVMTAGR